MSCGPQDYKRCVPSPKLRRSQIQWSSRIVQSISANRLEPAFSFGICPIPVHWHFFRHWFWSWLCCESWSPSLQEHLASNRCRRVARIQHLRVMGHVGQRGPGIAVIEKHTYLHRPMTVVHIRQKIHVYFLQTEWSLGQVPDAPIETASLLGSA